MKTIYLRINQINSNVPTIVGQFGDLEPFNFDGNTHERIGVGDYLLTLGNDVMDGMYQQPFLAHIQATIKQNAVAKLVQSGVYDVNVVSIKTFDGSGISCDLGGDLYLQINLKDFI